MSFPTNDTQSKQLSAKLETKNKSKKIAEINDIE